MRSSTMKIPIWIHIVLDWLYYLSPKSIHVKCILAKMIVCFIIQEEVTHLFHCLHCHEPCKSHFVFVISQCYNLYLINAKINIAASSLKTNIRRQLLCFYEILWGTKTISLFFSWIFKIDRFQQRHIPVLIGKFSIFCIGVPAIVIRYHHLVYLWIRQF